MINCALKENSSERTSDTISLAALLKETKDKIIKEKEKLYNYKFSSHSDHDGNDNSFSKLQGKLKEEEISKKELQPENYRYQVNKQKPVPHVPNIFKERVKLFLKHKNLL